MIASEMVRSSVTDDGVVLLDLNSGKLFTSNHTGARIWLKIQSGLDLNAITEQLSAELGVPDEPLRSDVRAFVQTLTANQLLTE